MNFSRNLYATMLIAVFGAIVLAGTARAKRSTALQAGPRRLRASVLRRGGEPRDRVHRDRADGGEAAADRRRDGRAVVASDPG